MNMDVVIATITSLVILSCTAMTSEAGATIDDDTGEMKVNNDTMMVEIHFFLYDQLQATWVILALNANV